MNNKMSIYKFSLAILIILIVGCVVFFFTGYRSNNDNLNTEETIENQTILPINNYSIVYSLTEVAKHDKAGDCWMVIGDVVLDVTNFIASGKHNPKIVSGCGRDATIDFDKIDKHSNSSAKDLLKSLIIGNLKR